MVNKNQDVVPAIHLTWQKHVHLISGLHGKKIKSYKTRTPLSNDRIQHPHNKTLMAECEPKPARCIHQMSHACPNDLMSLSHIHKDFRPFELANTQINRHLKK